MASIFTRIIAGEIPCHRVAEDEHFIAFLDINPVQMGHVLVVPKQEVDYLFDCDDALLGAMLPFSKRVANAIKRVVPCNRVGVVVIGLEVPHAHMHLIPISQEGDIDFRNKMTPSQEELSALAEQLREAYK